MSLVQISALTLRFSSTVTPDTPLDSMENLVSFYYSAIKREQPHGPYRLSAFSATSIVALALAKRLEAEGSVVAQLALLDHVPGFYACPFYGINKSILTNPAHLHDFHRICCEGICDLLRRDGGGRVPRRHQLAQELVSATLNVFAARCSLWLTCFRH